MYPYRQHPRRFAGQSYLDALLAGDTQSAGYAMRRWRLGVRRHRHNAATRVEHGVKRSGLLTAQEGHTARISQIQSTRGPAGQLAVQDKARTTVCHCPPTFFPKGRHAGRGLLNQGQSGPPRVMKSARDSSTAEAGALTVAA